MRRRKGLTPEDAKLWARVAATAAPLHPERTRPGTDEVSPPETAPAPSGPGLSGPNAPGAGAPGPVAPGSGASVPKPPRSHVSQPPRGAVPAFRVGQAVTHPRGSAMQPPSTPGSRLAEGPLRMDPKTHKRMTRGKLRPEARLDLHGMTLSEAHPQLIEFVLSCHAAGMRLILVITGKGRGDHGPLPTRPGALRHQVPFWLHSAPLSAAVQQATPAHLNHGGEGAYYVYLRRPRGVL